MADSSSESEAAFDIEEVPEDNRDHVREVLARGKQMAPFYSVQISSCRTLFCIVSTKDTTRLIMSSTMNSRSSLIAARNKTAARDGLQWEILKDRPKDINMIFSRINNVRLFLQIVIWRANNWESEEAKQRHHGNKKPR